MTLNLFEAASRDGAIDDVARRIIACMKCPHKRSGEIRRSLPGWGATKDVSVLVIGQYPGRGEDVQGRILTKPAGEFIRNQFYKIGLNDLKVYWFNIVCCPPPEGEDDLPATQVQNCATFLEEIIDALRPKIVVGLGNTVRRRLFGAKHMFKQAKSAESLMASRFKVWDYRGFPLVMIMNPASVLRKQSFEREMHQENVDRDFKFLRDLLVERAIL